MYTYVNKLTGDINNGICMHVYRDKRYTVVFMPCAHRNITAIVDYFVGQFNIYNKSSNIYCFGLQLND